MFGYVKTDTPNMFVKDTVLYRAMYCGLCKGIGCSCGQKARIVLNYDLTFLSILLHNVMGIDVKIEKQHCMVHLIGKRPMAKVDDLTKRIGMLNVILAYHKVRDDMLDNHKGNFKRLYLKSAYKKAKKMEPRLDEIIAKRYSELVELEKKNTDSVDFIAEPFGLMMRELVEVITDAKADNNLLDLAYELGRWIYLIDALDDFDKDKKTKNFNVFINLYKDVENKQKLITEKKEELFNIFGALLNDIKEKAIKLEYKFNHDLTDNILLLGLKKQTIEIMENKKCKNTTKS